MSIAQILTAILLPYLLFTCAEKSIAQPRIDDFLRPPPFHNQQPNSAPSSQESSYFSRFTSWIFPSDDQTPSATQSHSNPSASPSHPYPNPSAIPSRYVDPQQQENCNPCNNEPWVPVVSNFGAKKVIDFVSQQELTNNGRPNTVYGASNNNYRPPKQYAPSQFSPSYPPPLLPSQSGSFGSPKVNYRPPESSFTPPKYEAPSNLRLPKYGAPVVFNSRPPKYETPHLEQSSSKYRPSFQPNSQSEFTPSHSPFQGSSSNYGVPNSGSSPNKYGVPALPTPLNPDKYPQPSSNYGSPSITNLRPPPPTYAAPAQHPSAFMGPPPLVPNKFGSLDKHISPPNTQYSSPTTQDFETLSPPAVSTSYNSQKYIERPNNQYVSPTQSSFSPSNTYLQPPSAPAQSFVTPLTNYRETSKHLLTKTPVIDSYGPAPAGPISRPGQVKVTSDEYLPPPHELPISTGHEDTEAQSILQDSQQESNYKHFNPIPFPNMSPRLILPIYNARPFNEKQNPLDPGATASDSIPAHTGDRNQGGNVQIIKSVSVGDYLSTIEYPPNVVQSPIIDVETNEDIHEITSPDDLTLSQNPIVVDNDEHYQEASDNHASVIRNNSFIHTHQFPPNHQPSFKEDFPENNPSASENVNTTVVKIEPSLQTLLDGDNSLTVLNQLLNQNNKNAPKPFELSESSLKNQNNNDKTVKPINQNAQATNSALFTAPPLDYNNWSPSVGPLSTAMVPPPIIQNSWISTQNFAPFTTKKPKQIQIIVPYTSNNDQVKPVQNGGTSLQGRKVPQIPVPTNLPYSPPLSLFTKLPAHEESQWLKYVDHNFQESKTNAHASSPISNIQDFFKDSANVNSDNTRHLPFDILKLQKNIDVWTEQEYNKMKTSEDGKYSTSSRFTYSKKIPDEYFTTQSLDVSRNEMTAPTPRLFSDYVASGTFQHYIEMEPHNLTAQRNVNLLETNVIGSSEGVVNTQRPDEGPLATSYISESSGKPNTTPATWDKIQVSISPLTNERVYVVTPQPWETGATTPFSAWTYVPKKEIQEINKQLADNAQYIFNSPRFAVRPEPVAQNKTHELDMNNKIHFVYSDWPELINNLAITTTERPRPAVITTHPLLGRMDISADTTNAPQDNIIQTYTGHSKVVTAVTASSAAKKKSIIDDKKITTRETPDRV